MTPFAALFPSASLVLIKKMKEQKVEEKATVTINIIGILAE